MIPPESRDFEAGDVTLGELERRGQLSKNLIGHLERTHPAGWRHLTRTQALDNSNRRLEQFRELQAIDETTYIEAMRRASILERLEAS